MAQYHAEEERRMTYDQTPSVNGGFLIGHINANSLKPKINSIRCLIKRHGFDIFAVSESKLKSTDRDATIAVPGYRTVRFDRTNDGRGRGGVGGGLVCYLHKDVKYDRQTMSSQGANNTQFLAIHLTTPVDMDLVVVYNPPKLGVVNQMVFFLQSLLWRRDVNRPIIFIGDMNVDFFDMKRFPSEKIAELSLVQLISSYTRITKKTKSCLDHIYIKQTSSLLIKESGVLRSTLSDHDIIYCTLDICGHDRTVRLKEYQQELRTSTIAQAIENSVNADIKAKKNLIQRLIAGLGAPTPPTAATPSTNPLYTMRRDLASALPRC